MLFFLEFIANDFLQTGAAINFNKHYFILGFFV